MSKASPKKRAKIRRPHAHWIEHQLVCTCGSRKFVVFRERVQRKVRSRRSHRRRYVGICENGHKTRIGFPTNPKKK